MCKPHGAGLFLLSLRDSTCDPRFLTARDAPRTISTIFVSIKQARSDDNTNPEFLVDLV